MLEVRDLTKQFGGLRAVDGVSFTVRPSEVLGYLGPNGSGKTTTVNMVVGLIQPTHGAVTFDGQDIWRDIVAFRQRVGYVPEEPNLYSYLTGREYLELVGRLRELMRLESLEEIFSELVFTEDPQAVANRVVDAMISEG